MRFSAIFAVFAAVAIAAPTPDDPLSDFLGNIPGPFGDIASGISSAGYEAMSNMISIPMDIASAMLNLPREIASDVWGNLTPFVRKTFIQNYVDQQQQQQQQE